MYVIVITIFWCCLQIKKRCRKVDEFWAELGAQLSHSGEQTKRLFKNLASEYQKVKQSFHVSGMETDGEPVLRNSGELFAAFEQYYQLYFPQGGSTVPQLVMTEQSIALLSNLDNTTSASVHQNSDSEHVAGPSGEQLPSQPVCKVGKSKIPSGEQLPSQPVCKVVKSKIPLKRKCQAPADSMNVMIKLQNRQLQIERERLRVEKEKLKSVQHIQLELLKSVQGIQWELTAIRTALCIGFGVTIESINTEHVDKEQ